MRCTSPRTVGFKSDGKTIAWSQKNYSKEYASFQLPCGKCLECRLDYARQWAIRCVHEAQMHESNAFVTLTYSDEHLTSAKLQYRDFQLFVKRLRKHVFDQFLKSYGIENWKLLTKKEKSEIYESHKIGIFVTGEYGDRTKRPHWHACIFNWQPTDKTPKYTTDRGDQVYESETLSNLWGKGISEFGSITFDSAGYCARYAAKKLTHGQDGHEFEPISKKSSKHAIGKRWLEKYWTDVFNHGQIVLQNGQTCGIPRYYEKWLKNNKPQEWEKYATKRKTEKIRAAKEKSDKEFNEFIKIFEERAARQGLATTKPVTRQESRRIILEQKFNQLQKNLKL